MHLRKVCTVALFPSTPFDFDATFHKPDHFTSGDNTWEPGIRWQTWLWQGVPLGLKFRGLGSRDVPRLSVDVYHTHDLEESFVLSLAEEIRYRFNLDLDLAPFYRAFEGDPVLGSAIQRWWGMRPGHPSSLYEYLIIGVVLQNATVRRSVQMFKALLECFGTTMEFDGMSLVGFWPPGGLVHASEADLRALKLGYRARSIKRLDDYFAEGMINEFALRQQDRETQHKTLLKLYGVGPATVWYLLFDVFHHWDFFNHVSPWEQKIYSRLFFDQDPDDPVPVDRLLAHFERYGPYKQLAVHYLWEDLWWRREYEPVPWLEKLIRL